MAAARAEPPVAAAHAEPPTAAPPPSFDHLALARALPKAELHAHLHGCLRPQTLAELSAAASTSGVPDPSLSSALALAAGATPAPRSLSACFTVFAAVHACVRTAAHVERVVAEAAEDFAADGVKYAELRTTPRALEGEAGSPDDPGGARRYLEVVTAALAAAEVASGVVLRLLVSFNRARDPAAAVASLASALALREACPRLGCLIVGVDLSGDPTAGDVSAFLPTLAAARAAGLRLAVHVGEVLAPAETEALLDAAPDRLGHACVLAPAAVARLLASPARPPIELCPASNAVTLGLRALGDHPTLAGWLDAGYPLAICTDDPGVFGVTLSGELAAVAAAHRLSPHQLARLALASFRFSFLEEGALRERVCAGAADGAAAALAAAGCAGGW